MRDERNLAPGNLTPEQRDAEVVARLGRAAGADLRPLFKEWGFALTDR
jgi:hypothetical protein